MQNYTVLDCCFHWLLSVFSQALFSIQKPLTSLAELCHGNGICAVGAGSRELFSRPFKFSSCPAKIAAVDRR